MSELTNRPDIRFVAPNLVSIDGQSQPFVFLAEVLPWMLQSPLFPSIGMLMASTTQSLEKGIEVVKNPESLAIKARVLTGINDFLQGEFASVSLEVIRSVVNLVVMEVSSFEYIFKPSDAPQD